MRRPYSRGPVPRTEIQRKHKINDEIQAGELRVIGPQGEPLGVLPRREALKLAQEREMDLVEIAPQAVPPVCKIIDYGKFSYEQQKREKQQKKAQHQQILKEIRLRAGTDTHDLEFKTRHAHQFLLEGNKVKATVMFRGREIVHQDLGRSLLQKFIDALVDVSKIDQPMKTEGKTLSVTLAPEIKKKMAKEERKKGREKESVLGKEGKEKKRIGKTALVDDKAIGHEKTGKHTGENHKNENQKSEVQKIENVDVVKEEKE